MKLCELSLSISFFIPKSSFSQSSQTTRLFSDRMQAAKLCVRTERENGRDGRKKQRDEEGRPGKFEDLANEEEPLSSVSLHFLDLKQRREPQEETIKRTASFSSYTTSS